MNIRLDDETDATAAKSKILLQFEFHNSQYQPNLSRYTAIPVNPPKDGNTLGYQSIGNRGREVTSTIYDQSNRNVAHYLKRWTLIGMETENDKTAVVGETSNSKAIRLEDRLQTINLSLKSSIQLVQELASDIQLAMDTQEQLNQIVDPFVAAVAHHSTDSKNI